MCVCCCCCILAAFAVLQVRKGLEYLSFANAFCLLGLLVWLHLAFVNPNPQTHCLAQYSKGKAMSLTEADVVKIHISSRWSSPSCISCRNPDTSKADLPEDLQRLRPDLLSDIPTLFETFTDAIGMHYDDSPRKKADVSKQPVLDVIRQAQFMQSSSVWAEYEASLFDLFLRDKVYLFSVRSRDRIAWTPAQKLTVCCRRCHALSVGAAREGLPDAALRHPRRA